MEREDKKLSDLLPEFYSKYGLGPDGGQTSSSVRIELTKNIILYIPNFKARKDAVLMHDIHHIVTGYPSTYKGETEIGAWEVGSGCRGDWAAWALDMSSVMTGLLFNPLNVLKAFARGRRTKNLYHRTVTEAEALDMKLADLKKILLLEKYPHGTMPSVTDVILFLLLILAGLIYSALTLLLLPFVIGYTIYIMMCPKRSMQVQ